MGVICHKSGATLAKSFNKLIITIENVFYRFIFIEIYSITVLETINRESTQRFSNDNPNSDYRVFWIGLSYLG